MGELVCTEEGGWSGIAAALAQARPGDMVRLRRGFYPGHETLLVPTGVNLTGEPGVTLRFEADGPAVRFREVERAGLADVMIEAAASSVALRSFPEDPASDTDVPIRWGLVYVERSNEVRLSCVEITAPAGRFENLCAIAFWSSKECVVTGCRIMLSGRYGIILSSSRALINSNHVGGMIHSGITLFSSKAEAITDNECWANQRSGIVLQRDPKSPDQPSRACLDRNHCHDNAQAGIILFSSEAEAITNNECWSNQRSGIVLARDSNSPDQPSRARLDRNRCHDNAEAGITLFSSEAEAITDNECWANQRSGIVLARDSNSPDQPSRARLDRNRCHDNAETGIALLSSEAEAITDNECWANQGSGIGLARDPDRPDQPSRARLDRNRCHDNAETGIILFSSEAEAITDNECWSNQRSGIVLARDPDSPDQPSRARLDRNRCHDNAETGIALLSSEAEAITDNECWSNQLSGIDLGRDPNSPDQPSRARLDRNRCHDNADTGITLFSSEAEAITDNECWANQRSGIVLARDSKSPDHPSRAHLDRNRCHDNAQAGIILFSSEAEAITDNECWANQRSGIVLQRDSISPDQPSRARITGNICDHNGGPGFALLSADVIEFDRNRVWENLVPSLIPDPADPASNNPWTPPETALATTADPQAVERRRAQSRSGELERRLAQAGCTNPGALASFVAGPGCAKCLAAAWRSGDALTSASKPRPDDDQPQAGRFYRLVSDASSKQVFEGGGWASLTDQVWRFARRVAEGRAGVGVFGVLGDTRHDMLDALFRDVRLLSEAERGDERGLLAQSKLCHAAFRSFDRQGRRIGVLLDVDCESRSLFEMVGAVPPQPLFQIETLGDTLAWRLPSSSSHSHRRSPTRRVSAPTSSRFGQSVMWRHRLLLLVRPLPLISMIGGMALFLICLATLGRLKGFSGDVGNVVGYILGASYYYIRSVVAGSQLWDWPTLLAIACFIPASAVFAANHFLPSILRFKPPEWVQKYGLRFLGLERSLLNRNDSKVALSWVSRRLFGTDAAQGFALLVLRNPDLWIADDLDRLRALVAHRPAKQGLAIVVPLRHASQIASGLISPWLGSQAMRQEATTAVDIEVHVLPEPPGHPIDAIRSHDPLILLGADAPDEAARQRVYRSLCDDRLTADDFIPLLVFGSTPESPFVIAYDEQNLEPSLDEVATPYGRFMADTQTDRRSSFEPADVEERIRHSPCAMLHVERAGKRSRRWLIGRDAYRDELAAALRPIFVDEGIDFNAYVHGLAGCGQLYNLAEFARLLDSGPLSHQSLRKVVRHLRAVAALAQDATSFPKGGHRFEILLKAWTDVVARLPSMELLPNDDAHTDALEVMGLAFGAAAPDPERALAGLLSLMNGLETPLAGLEPRTIQIVFAEEIRRVLTALSELDPDYARRLLEHQFATSWRAIATPVRTELNKRIQTMRAAQKSLAERLVRAATYEDFARILQAHRGDLPRFMALCYCLAVRSTTAIEKQQLLAETMLRHRAAGLEISPAVQIGFPDCAGAIIYHLADPLTENAIQTAGRVKEHETEGYEDEYVYLGSFDRLSAEVQNVVEITLLARGNQLGSQS